MPEVGESVKRRNWYKKQVPNAIVGGGENYRAGQAAANKKRIFLQIVHTQLDKVIAGIKSYVGISQKLKSSSGTHKGDFGGGMLSAGRFL